MKSRGLLTLLAFSEKREELILFLLEEPRTLEEIYKHLKVTSPEIIPRIKEMEDKNLVCRENKKYALTPTGPHAINGGIDVIINVAKDTAHKPTQPITSDNTAALSRFNTNFGVTMSETWFWNHWGASDASPSTDTYQVLLDLKEDTGWMRTQDNDIVLGWAHELLLFLHMEFRIFSVISINGS